MIVLTSDAVKALDAAERERDELVSSHFDPAVVRERQRDKLDKLWDRLGDVPYYRDMAAIRDRDLAGAPVTAKDTVKAEPFAFLRESVTSYAKYYESSGSTGLPTATPRLAEDMIWNAVSVSAVWGRTLRPGDRVASLVPSDVAPVGDLVAAVAENLGCALLRCYPFAQGICDWDRLADLFTRYRPDHVFVAPGVLSQWTRLLKQRGSLAEVASSVRTLMLLGEVSTAALRRRLGLSWNATAIDVSYGSTETGTIAAGCEHDRMHLLLAGHLLEVRSGTDVEPAEPGHSGELVTTTLNNYARPLVRFGTGDIVSVADDCRCELRLPTLTVHGRQSENVTIAGTTVSVQQIESILYEVDGTTGYVVQLRRPDGAQARLVIEQDVDFTGDVDDLCAEVRRRFAAVDVRWQQVVSVRQLPAVTKAGGSRKNWKRTNVQWVD